MKWSRRSHQSAWTPQGGLEVDGGALRGTRRSKETATSPVKLIFFFFSGQSHICTAQFKSFQTRPGELARHLRGKKSGNTQQLLVSLIFKSAASSSPPSIYRKSENELPKTNSANYRLRVSERQNLLCNFTLGGRNRHNQKCI